MQATAAELKHIAIVHTLRSCQLFSGLPLPDLEEIAALVTVRSLSDDTYLFHQGEVSLGFYLVQRGAVNVHRVNTAGKEQVIHVFRAGESFAEASLATATGYPAEARAIGDTQVLLVQKDGFVALLRRRPELALRMLAAMSSHLRVLVAQLEDLTLKDVETRLASWLVKRCADPAATTSFTVELRSTKRVLAAELGTVGETLSRALAKFRDQGLIKVGSRSVVVLEPARLSALLRRYLGEQT